MRYIFGNKLNILSIIDEHFVGKKRLLLCDKNLYALYNNLVEQISSDVLVLDAGEDSKSQDNLFAILSFLMDKGYTRSDCIISLGGGVIGDLGGLAASMYMRGMGHTIVPTSIIAMSDSSIGGKTAINYMGVKNIFGSFYEPSLVIADTEFLHTLPEYEFRSGLGELLKVCLLTGKIDLLMGDIEPIIEHAAEYKTRLVKEDLHDKSIRHLLNLGHTMGHAIELAYHISHGEAVAMGIDFVTSFGDSLGVSNNLNPYIVQLIQMLKLRTMDSISLNENVLHNLYSDKKRDNNTIDLVMLENIAKPIIKPVAIEEIINFAKDRYLK